MALSVEDLAVAIKLTMDGEDLLPSDERELTRMLANAEAEILLYAPGAPEGAREEAAIRLIAYRHPIFLGKGAVMANAFLNSGAAAVLKPWRASRGVRT